ncbi:FAD/NAD(P)-binding protein [Streptomyces sp. NPDC048172]|uniref:FAD/NAD(P)-binding protein n=1 Tax=Streptomyces sp. NPDC048172 TaxID=3365505 RepID=UPI0037148C08
MREPTDLTEPTELTVALVGAGPRGLSVLERLAANAALFPAGPRLTVHLVDPHPPGAGRVWRTEQPAELLMNTVASQVTVFTDASVELVGPVTPGPSLYEWARFLSLMGPFDGVRYGEEVLAEARTLGPDAYPTRAFYGHYLEWAFRRVHDGAPDRMRCVVHRARAVELTDEDVPGEDVPGEGIPGENGPHGLQRLRLENGTELAGLHAVVLAQGHLPLRRTRRQEEYARFAAARGLRYVAPANPADLDLSPTVLPPEEPVALLGLGLNFFDLLSLLTTGRGGSFVRRDGRLVYVRSGAEPRLIAGSRRGIPFHARGDNQKGPHGRHVPLVLTDEVIDQLRERARAEAGLDFREALWPLIAKEVETVYYAALLQAADRPADARRVRAAYPGIRHRGKAQLALLRELGIPREERWSWQRIATPYAGRRFGSPGEFRTWLLEHLRRDVAAARGGNVDDAVKAALDVLRDLRNEVRQLVEHGGLTGPSHREHLDGWYTPLNAYLSIGPPARRIEEAIALLEAGVLEVLGPGTRARTDEESGRFVVESAEIPGARAETRALIEARLPGIDLRHTADPLLTRLLVRGECRTHVLNGPHGSYETGGVAVTPRPYRMLDAEGRAHPRRFVFGVPTESVHWATAAGIRPGVNSVTLCDADALARAVLAFSGERPEGNGTPADESPAFPFAVARHTHTSLR